MTGGTISVDGGRNSEEGFRTELRIGRSGRNPGPRSVFEELALERRGKNVNKAKLKKIKRSSGAYQITFNNEQGFTKVTVPVSTTTAGTADVKKSVSGTGIASVTFTASELAYLPNYVSGPSAISANSEFVRLPALRRGRGIACGNEMSSRAEPRTSNTTKKASLPEPEWNAPPDTPGSNPKGASRNPFARSRNSDSFVGQGNEF